MKFNFDETVDRRNTCCIKYDFAKERGKPEGLIPLWVADMDFRTAPCVTQALVKSAEHSIFGYTDVKREGAYFNAINKWFSERFNFEVKPEWVIKTPGVVFAIYAAIRAYTETDDAVLIQTPVYYPFRESVIDSGRRLVTNPLLYMEGKYKIDFDDFEDKIVKNKVKLFILCTPHNPVGRVWTKEELRRMGEICLKHKALVLSDEIHCDFVFPGNKHTVFGSISGEFLNNSIICTSPSKTFNLAGLQTANVFIADSELRRKFRKEISFTGYSQLNTMGIVSCQAAYEDGGEWVDEMLVYLKKNYVNAKDYISVNLPKIHVNELEGTYLMWLDFNKYKLTDAELDKVMVEKAKLWVSNGTIFGDEGKGFIRINIACPLSTLERALNQLEAAFK